MDTKKPRFSDHIMPRRIVRRFIWLCAESAVLYVIFKITSVLWRSIMLGVPALRWPLFFVMVVLMAAFPALWQAVRLARDTGIRGEFQHSVSDGSYDHRAELAYLLRTDELWNDTAVVAALYLPLYLYRLYALWFSLMTNPELTLADVGTVMRYYGIENAVFWVLFVAAFAAWHLLFTAEVHRRWDSERIRHDETPDTARKPYM